MTDVLLYDRELKRFYSPNDILSYEDWLNTTQTGKITKHPDGYYIALPYKLISDADEYEEDDDDPYWSKINPAYNSSQQRRINCTLSLLRETKIKNAAETKILDFACGMGSITAEIRNTYDKAQLIGLDISEKAISHCARKFPDTSFVLADGFNAPFADATFDIIVCNNFWEHIENPFLLAREISRLLKDGGSLVLSTPSRYHFDNLWSVLRGKRVHFQNPRFHYTEYSIGQIKEQLERNKFIVSKIISQPIEISNVSFKTWLKHKFVKVLIQKFLEKMKSHHVLENTAFVLARKKVN
jgi:SAM-dependent methyltransferase